MKQLMTLLILIFIVSCGSELKEKYNYAVNIYTEVVYKVGDIDRDNQRFLIEPVWSEVGEPVCTGYKWHSYDSDTFTMYSELMLADFVRDTCGKSN